MDVIGSDDLRSKNIERNIHSKQLNTTGLRYHARVDPPGQSHCLYFTVLVCKTKHSTDTKSFYKKMPKEAFLLQWVFRMPVRSKVTRIYALRVQFPFKIPTKILACTDSRCFLVTMHLKTTVLAPSAKVVFLTF